MLSPRPDGRLVKEAGDRDSGVRLAELVAAFSLAIDLGLGQPMEHQQFDSSDPPNTSTLPWPS